MPLQELQRAGTVDGVAAAVGVELAPELEPAGWSRHNPAAVTIGSPWCRDPKGT